ncbi:flavodoxin family protein [Streptomyces sp. NPDC051001]|uniref:flavodoxin family protein n=1 Tax=Streptomyces sp. NPDC051001 TaxID=3155795 RepID=UPI003418EB3D
MKALVINCTLKKSPEPSNTEALASVVAERLSKKGVDLDVVRAVDLNIAPGERMDAMMSETDDEDRPVAYNRVAGVVVTGNEDGAHHVISEISGALADIGYTIPGQAWTYWHLGPGPGPDYLEEQRGREWAHRTGGIMADNLHGVAEALMARPLSAPA